MVGSAGTVFIKMRKNRFFDRQSFSYSGFELADQRGQLETCQRIRKQSAAHIVLGQAVAIQRLDKQARMQSEPEGMIAMSGSVSALKL
jgi:hypothetical protein